MSDVYQGEPDRGEEAMKGIELAKEVLVQEVAALVVVRDQEVLYVRHGGGLRPLFDLVQEVGQDLAGSVIADKLTGQTAARLYQEVGIVEVFAYTMSAKARDILDQAGIKYQTDRIVDKIMNRTQDDLCPMEKIAEGSTSNQEMMAKIQAFFDQVDLKKAQKLGGN